MARPVVTAVRIGGVDFAASVRRAGVQVKEHLGPAPFTGAASFGGLVAPVEGQQIEIALLTESPERLLFSGEIQTVSETYQGEAAHLRWDCTLIDRTFKANRRRPFGSWTSTSATTIALAIAAQYAPDCSTAGIAVSLPAVSIVFDGSESFMACMQRLAVLIQGRATLSYANVLGLFQTDVGETPDPVDTSHPPLDVPPIAFSVDLSQIRTRMLGKGIATKLLLDTAIAATELPVSDVSAFGQGSPTAGQAILALVPGANETVVVDYAGIIAGGLTSTLTNGEPFSGGGGSVAEPTTKIIGRIAAGSYQYALGYNTATGTSTIGNIGSVTVSDVNTSNVGNGISQTTGGALTPGSVYYYDWTVVTANGETGSVASTNFTLTGGNNAFVVSTGPYADARILKVNIYRSKAGTSSPSYLVGSISKASTSWTDTVADSGLTGQQLPTSSTAGGGAASLTSLTTSGDSRVTGRTLYRTTVGGSNFYVLATLDNLASTYIDTAADSALGTLAPTVSTIAIKIGKDTVALRDLSVVPASGFVTIGTQTIKYTGRSASSGAGTLTGIPTSGAGSIVAPIPYGSAVSITPQLTGVNAFVSPTGIQSAVLAGSAVAVWVKRDNAAAQTALAALEGGDGIREDTLYDSSLDETALTAALDAKLAQFDGPIVSARYSTFDVKTRPGALVHINLPIGPAAADYVIQDVAKTLVGAELKPRYAVMAASQAFTLMDAIRLTQLQQP